MPNWHEIMQELNRSGSTFDVIRRRYLKRLSEYTGRNVIAYYSGCRNRKLTQDISLSQMRIKMAS